MGQEETEYTETEVQKISANFKGDVGIQPIQRCSKVGVSDFIAKEASSYSWKVVGTINNSVAKKAVDEDLNNERKEIDLGTHIVGSIESNITKYPSDISKEKIKELLTTLINNWVFQTSNAHKLVTFYAKSSYSKTEIFINFKEDGDRSHICLGSNFGYLSSDVLNYFKYKINNVYNKITEEVSGKELVWENIKSDSGATKLEIIKLKDPDYWNTLKENALQEFMLDEVSFFEKVLNFFELVNHDSIPIYHLLQEESLNDNTVVNYLLDNIKIDIKQIYA